MVLSTVLLIFCVFLSIRVKHLQSLRADKLSVDFSDEETFGACRNSLLSLMIYFPANNCESCMEEAFTWNKLFFDLTREELTVMGVTDDEELTYRIKDKYQLLFPVAHDRDGAIRKRLNIVSGPQRVIADNTGNILYLSPASSKKTGQECFYFEVIDMATKARVRDVLKSRYR